MPRILLVRHAQTIENAERRFQGHTHGRLSEQGKKQAKALGERLKNEKIDFGYTSPLDRVARTLDETVKHHPNLKMVYCDYLKERKHGKIDGLLVDEVEKTEPGIMKKMHVFDYRPEGGESLEDVRTRAEKFVDELLSKHNGDETILVGGHQMINSAILGALLKSDAHFVQGNACLNELEVADGRVKARSINDLRHLG